MPPAWMTSLRPAGPEAPVPASAPETVATAARIIGNDATAWAVQVAADITEALATEGRQPATGLPVTGLERQATEACLLTVLAQLHSPGAPVPSPPDEAVEQVRLAVRQGATVDNLLRVVWTAHTGVQDALLDVVTHAVPPQELAPALRAVTSRMFTFVDGLVRRLAQIYDAERTAWHDRLAASRRDVLDRILESGQAPTDADGLLGLRIAGSHLAAVLWPTTTVRVSEWHAAAGRFVDRLSRELSADQSLALDRPDGSVEVCWSFAAAPGASASGAVCRADRPEDLALAVGPQGSGAQGLRDSLLGARQAMLVGRLAGAPGAWSYDEDALLALLTSDLPAARRFVHHVLAGLTDSDARSTAIRETLHHYLQHGRSRILAARDLHLAANTVAYRVRQAEELLGRPATERTVETIIALRLARHVPQLLG